MLESSEFIFCLYTFMKKFPFFVSLLALNFLLALSVFGYNSLPVKAFTNSDFSAIQLLIADCNSKYQDANCDSDGKID